MIIIQNNEICRNSGSAIASIRSSPVVVNNTIVANFGGDHAISTRVYSQVKVINCIIWANSPSPAGGGSEITITYSNIQGGRNEIGNINTDPFFVDAVNGDYRLQDKSPCIGSGIEAPDIPGTDILGNPRPNPPGSRPDMGAHEH